MAAGMTPQAKNQINEISSSLSKLRWQNLVSNFIDKLASLVFATIIFFLILWIGKIIINSLFTQTRRIEILGGNRRAATFHMLTLNIFRYTCYLFYLYAVLSMIGVPIGTLIAGAGIFSIALGLGAQGFVSDMVNGLFLLLEQQLDVGDVVEIGQIKGTITSLGLRTTKILSADGTLNFIPNRNITTVKNYSRHQLTQTLDLPLAPAAPLDQVNQIINQEIANHLVTKEWQGATATILGPVTVKGQLFYQLSVTANTAVVANLASELLNDALKALNTAGIAFAPTFNQPTTTN